MANPFKKRKAKYYKLPKELFDAMPMLSSSAWCLYCYFCKWETCFASYKEIRKSTGLSYGTISKSIQQLLTLNMLTYDQGNSIGKNTANYYKLNDSDVWTLKATPKTEVDQLQKIELTTPKTRAAQLQKLETINTKNTDNQYSGKSEHVIIYDSLDQMTDYLSKRDNKKK